MKTILTIFTIILFVSGNAWGATYYINNDGSVGANGEDCDHAYSISWANSSSGDGDTIRGCDDTYTTNASPPAPNQTWEAVNECSGSPGSYSGAVFDGSNYGFNLGETDDNITIDGWCFEQTNNQWIRADGADGLVVTDNHFYEANSYSGVLVGPNSSNYSYDILFQRNTFEDGEDSDPRPDMPSDMLRLNYAERVVIGNQSGESGNGNWFGNARHHCVGTGVYHPDYVVIRGNTFKNEWHAAAELAARGHHHLIESNDVYDGRIGGNPYDDTADAAGIYITSTNQVIVRKNRVWDGEYGIILGYTYIENGYNAYVYHNTFYNNWMQIALSNNSNATNYWYNYFFKNNIFALDGWGSAPTETSGTCFWDATESGEANGPVHLVSCANSAVQSSYYDTNLFEYNLFQNQTDYFYWPNTDTTQQSLASLESSYSYWANNVNGDPVFTDEANDDFTLQATSDAIDAGSGLTTITSSTGSGTQFTVDDAGYFYDGWNISGETGDVIKTQNGETCTIQSISGNTITCNPSISWTQGEWVALDYEGSAPDIGAEEYQQTGVTMTITTTDSSGAEEGTDPVEFTMACSPDCNATAVNYSFSGGAVLDTDYNCDDEDGTITITGSSDTITCTPVDDGDTEITETITVTVDSGTGYTVGSPSQASATITDNDGAQDQGIAGITVDGSGSGQITYDQSGTGRWTRGDYGVEYQ